MRRSTEVSGFRRSTINGEGLNWERSMMVMVIVMIIVMVMVKLMMLMVHHERTRAELGTL
jgi:heme/copper-type cytochrome/quinol oxidase subunit 2